MACGLGLANLYVKSAVGLTQSALVEALRMIPLQGLTVLVVDDDSDFRKSIARILRLAGAEVSVTGSVEGALQLLEKNRWDVVVTDIGMPLLSGYDLIRQARQRGNRIPMIAVTAFDTPEHRRQILRHGFAYYLTKPFDPNHLLAVVGETVGTGAMHQIN
jgi:CheY-like chemotaxis protein